MEGICIKESPAPVGPYSQAIRSGNLIFVSGQIALDQQTGQLMADAAIECQTVKVLEQIRAILKAAGSDLDYVVKATVYLAGSLDDFGVVNQIWSECFSRDPKPARETVAVAQLPKGAKIEISVIAEII